MQIFNLVHGVLTVTEQREIEQRRAVRESFDGIQSIAPYGDGQPPDPADFRQVRCQDLSVNGVSYFDDEPPTFNRFLMVLGSNPAVCMIGEVIRYTKVAGVDGPEFVIGCKFVGRAPAD